MENTNLIGFKNQKIINLNNVSNIYLDESGQKVIFNMDYSVKIFNNKFTPDYVYWTYEDEDEATQILDLLSLNTKDWILPAERGQRYLNPKFISSITLDTNKTRVIFNLNYNVTHPKDINKLTSDFVFYDFANIKNYQTFVDSIINQTKKA
jgi:hypothetical protein